MAAAAAWAALGEVVVVAMVLGSGAVPRVMATEAGGHEAPGSWVRGKGAMEAEWAAAEVAMAPGVRAEVAAAATAREAKAVPTAVEREAARMG